MQEGHLNAGAGTPVDGYQSAAVQAAVPGHSQAVQYQPPYETGYASNYATEAGTGTGNLYYGGYAHAPPSSVSANGMQYVPPSSHGAEPSSSGGTAAAQYGYSYDASYYQQPYHYQQHYNFGYGNNQHSGHYYHEQPYQYSQPPPYEAKGDYGHASAAADRSQGRSQAWEQAIQQRDTLGVGVQSSQWIYSTQTTQIENFTDERYNAVAPPGPLMRNVQKHVPTSRDSLVREHPDDKHEQSAIERGLYQTMVEDRGRDQSSTKPFKRSESSSRSQAQPAYLKVETKSHASKKGAKSAADKLPQLTPNSWPATVKSYVESAFKATPQRQRSKLQDALRLIIADAQNKGELWTRPWGSLPLPDLSCSATDAAATVNEIAAVHIDSFISHKAATKPAVVKSAASAALEAARRLGAGSAASAASVRERNIMVRSEGERDELPTAFDVSVRKKRKHSRTYTWSDSDSDPASQGGPYAEDEEVRRRRREKRFEQGKPMKEPNVAKRTTSAQRKVSKSEGGNNSKVSDLISDMSITDHRSIDWDAFAIKGTCKTLEKSYFRLTSAPDPRTVRPEPILRKALKRLNALLAKGEVTYFYALDQFKGMRQDCVVQAIKGPLALDIYESHARAALEYGDIAEYNQCQSQMAALRAEGVLGRYGKEAEVEFLAYRVLYQAVHSKHGESSALLGTLQHLRLADRSRPEVLHALKTRAALASRDAVAFFRLYNECPKLGRALMDLAVPNIRFQFLVAAIKAFKPSIDVDFLARVLGFYNASKFAYTSSTEGGYADGRPLPGCHSPHFIGKHAGVTDVDEARSLCFDWLSECNAVVVGSGCEAVVDCKASTGRLIRPQDKDAVAHGDANLDIGDFLKGFGDEAN